MCKNHKFKIKQWTGTGSTVLYSQRSINPIIQLTTLFSPSISEVNKKFFFFNFLIGCIYMCVIFSFIMPCWHITYLKHNNRKLTVLGFTIFRVILLSDFSIRFSSPSSPCPIMSSYMYLSILVPASQMCKFTVSINCRKLFLLSQTKRNYWNTVKYKYVHARYICACK